MSAKAAFENFENKCAGQKKSTGREITLTLMRVGSYFCGFLLTGLIFNDFDKLMNILFGKDKYLYVQRTMQNCQKSWNEVEK